MSGNITFQNISQTILDTLDRMHHICLGFALLLIFLSIYRNFQQFGEFLAACRSEIFGFGKSMSIPIDA